MKKVILIFTISVLFLLIYKPVFAQPNIIINEISQGDALDHDWIELVVTEDGTDIRGVYFTTQVVSPNFTNKSVQLSTTNTDFASVAKGSIILIYKAGAKDLNLPADDLDFTDGKIIIPSDNTTFLESSGSGWPAFQGTGSNIGLLTSGGIGIHALAYGNGVLSDKFGPGTWGQAHIPGLMSAGSSSGSLYYTQQSSGQAGNSANWTFRSDVDASPGVIDGNDDRSISVTSPNIIINEISQGDALDHDWIELVVTEDGTDIRGVYFTTQVVSPNFTNKSVQLSTTNTDFTSVAKGSIILIYKAGAKDLNLPADDLDFTDGKIIIPSDNTTFLESSGSGWPAFQGTGSNIGLLTSGGIGIHALAYGDGVLSNIFGPGTWGQVSTPTTMSAGSSTGSLHFAEGTTNQASNSANWIYTSDASATPGALNGGNNNALPVELSSFSSSVIGSIIKLSWRTETEVSNYGFEVLRQTQDENHWIVLGFVEGHGNTNSPNNYSFIDENLPVGRQGLTDCIYSYRLKQIDTDGKFEYSKTIEVLFGSTEKFELSQNYPNPFNPNTTINYVISERSKVSIKVFDLLGSEVGELVNSEQEAGEYKVDFNASGLTSGIYFYRLQTESFTETKKMILMK